MVDDKGKYKLEAQKIFKDFRAAFAKSENFWRLGNSFDTAIDYFEIIEATDPKAFGAYAIKAFHKFPGHWYDDYGWWGLAALRAADRPYLFPDLSGDFLSIVSKCWKFFHTGDRGDMDVLCADCVTMTGGPGVWAVSQAGEDAWRFVSLKPRVDGGVWNGDWRWSPDQKTDKCYCVPIAGQAKDALCGVQNTVTNALYLALASRLAARKDADAGIRKAADAEYNFLTKWFAVENARERLLQPIGETASFVRERISVCDDGNDVYAYRPGLAWSGDHGLMLGGLIDYARVNSTEPVLVYVQLIAAKIVFGTQTYLNGPDDLLRPWWNPDDDNHAPGWDDDDYLTGPGVYARFLLHGYRTNTAVRTLIGTDDSCQDFLRRNAEAACGMPNAGSDPDEKLLIKLTNKLAMLIAAYAMLNK